MKNSYVVTVGDLVIADFSDSIYVMALATCISFVSVNYIKKKILVTHFLRPNANLDDKTKNLMAYVDPGITMAIKQFERDSGTHIFNCQNYLIGGITKEFSQYAGEIGDLNVKTARQVLQNEHIGYYEFVGGKYPKTIYIRDGIVTVKTTED